MASSQLLCSTDLSGDAPIIAAGRSAVAEYERLKDFLDEKGEGLSMLFAEPVFGQKTPTGYKNASWYTPLEGQATRYLDLPEAARPAVADKLRSQIEALSPWFDDPNFGPLLRIAVVIPSQDCIMAVGDCCVLLKWGMVPAQHAQGEDSLRRLFVKTVGAVAGLSRLPNPETSSPTTVLAAAPEEKPTPINDTQTTRPPANHAASGVGAVEGGVEGGVETAAAPSSFSPSQPAAAERVAEPKIVAATLRHHPLTILAVVLTAVLLGVILTLWLLGQRTIAVQALPQLKETDRRILENGTVEILRTERDRLRALLNGDVCRADPALLPGGSLSRPVQPTVPPDPQLQDGKPPAESKPPPVGEAAKQSTLNNYLERSTVMVLTESGMGSGFFIAPDTIVTNRHVVELEKGVAAKVAVTSKALGRIALGRVVAISDASVIGNRDYAVIKLDGPPPPNSVSLPLARSVEKRATVVAAGYPGYLVLQDPDMQRLNRGDISAAPEMVLSDGKVQVIHHPVNSPPIIIHSADISQGNSGGPLVDDCGRLVGINTFIGLDEQSGRRGLFSLGGADLIDFLTERNVPVKVDASACSPR